MRLDETHHPDGTPWPAFKKFQGLLLGVLLELVSIPPFADELFAPPGVVAAPRLERGVTSLVLELGVLLTVLLLVLGCSPVLVLPPCSWLQPTTSAKAAHA